MKNVILASMIALGSLNAHALTNVCKVSAENPARPNEYTVDLATVEIDLNNTSPQVIFVEGNKKYIFQSHNFVGEAIPIQYTVSVVDAKTNEGASALSDSKTLVGILDTASKRAFTCSVVR